MPIDFFFNALAADQREQAVAVILSGTGSDGTEGLSAIKDNDGFAMVPSPESAQFDSMPRSAIDAGLADIVGTAKDLAKNIMKYSNHSHCALTPAKKTTSETNPQSPSEHIITLIRDRTGNDFSLNKNNTINRRIERRMELHQIERTCLYLRYLRDNPQGIDLLFKELLIGVTYFFHDEDLWE